MDIVGTIRLNAEAIDKNCLARFISFYSHTVQWEPDILNYKTVEQKVSLKHLCPDNAQAKDFYEKGGKLPKGAAFTVKTCDSEFFHDNQNRLHLNSAMW